MKITFYQVNMLFLDNASYLGELIELKKEEVNTNMSNISRINLLLNKNYQDYNYIKVEKEPNDNYYYILETQEYYNAQKWRFHYKIDIIRTLHEKGLLSHNVNVQRYSQELDMHDEEREYFWKNQEVKLGADLIEKYANVYIKYSDHDNVQEKWRDIKWLYLWLQPRAIDNTQTVAGSPILHQYRFKKQIKENVIEVASESNLQLGERILTQWDSYDDWPEGQVYFVTATQRYYRVVVDWYFPPLQNYYQYYKEFRELKDFEYGEITYYLQDIPAVKIPNVPNSLYCLALPLSEIIVVRQYFEGSARKTKEVSWWADNVIPYLFDVNTDNTWNDFIVDAKVSLVPPFEINNANYNIEVTWAPTNYPLLRIPNSVPGNDFRVLNTLSESTLMVAENEIKTSNVFLPFLTNKLNTVHEVATAFEFPEINKENVIQKKFYLSTVEQRAEIDIVKLANVNAKTLYYYEDVFPGRTNIMFGYGPEDVNNEYALYFLIHSPSTMFFDRDTSLPIFTSQYQSYLASNKNFVQQAQLQRNSDLTQSLVASASSALGASTVAQSLKDYSPYAALANSMGKTVNAFINYGVQTKQFNWSVDNMKSAPGNYKAATATVSMMLSLNIFNLWIEQFKSSNFDIKIYDDLIDDVGFEYFNFTFNLKAIIDNAFTGTGHKKYLQAQMTGFTNDREVPLAIINILQRQLREGINIFVDTEPPLINLPLQPSGPPISII